MSRDINELKRILNGLPLISLEDKGTLLKDLSELEVSFGEFKDSNIDDVQAYFKSRLEMVEQARVFVSSGIYNEYNLAILRELYAPIYEEVDLVPITLKLDPSFIQDLDGIRKEHPYNEKYEIDDFIHLILIEKVVAHSRNKNSGTRIFDYLKRVLPVLFSR